MLPKAIAYVKSYDGQTKWMYFLIKDEEKYNTIWDSQRWYKKKNLIARQKRFLIVYNEKFSKTKIKFHGGEVTDFYDKNNS